MKTFKLYTHIDWKKYAWESMNDSRHIRWDIKRCYYGDPHRPPEAHEKVFYTDSELVHATGHNCAARIAYMLESRQITPHFYEYLENNARHFDIILSHDLDLVNRFPDKAVFYPHCNCIIRRKEFRIYDKTRLISFISSGKKMDVSGHQLRHEFYQLYQNRRKNWMGTRLGNTEVDLFGSLSGHYIENKLDSLRDYRFQIVVENSIIDTYFTEKIIDCLVTGTVPVYYGTDRIREYFNMNGILQFRTLDQLVDILPSLSEEDYKARQSAIEDNYNRAQEYIVAEDWLYKNTSVFD